MLENLSAEIRQCYEHAEGWARQAKAASDEKQRVYYLSREEGWLKLARSYELRERLTLFINEAARRKNDLDQNIGAVAGDNRDMEWQPISTAPFDRDLELAVLDGRETHALVFACRRILGGWEKSATRERIYVTPTHWRPWPEPTPSTP